MSTFDNLKETLTNKLDEIKNDLNNDSTEQQNTVDSHADDTSSLHQDTYDVSEQSSHTQIIDEGYPVESVHEEDSVERLETDYDLNQEVNAAEDYTTLDESYDSGLDDSDWDSDNVSSSESLIVEDEPREASSADKENIFESYSTNSEEEQTDRINENSDSIPEFQENGKDEELVYSNVEDEDGQVRPFETP